MKLPLLRLACAAALCAVQTLAAAEDAAAQPTTPHYGDTLFLFFQDKYFDAITTLMVSQQAGRIAPHDDEAEVLRGGMLLSYGLHDEAGAVFARLIEHNARPAVRDRAWFFLARLRYQRGLLALADDALARVAGVLPAPLEEDRLLLKAQLRMAHGDHAGAASVLAPVRGAAGAPLRVTRFNLGVALVKSGDAAGGNALLDELGRAPAADEEERSLRDRANVALGFAALAASKPQNARDVLQRVRLAGPQSNKALLGFGWAAAELKQPKDALVPWTELATRDASDAAVLEARIALPYAYAELGATAEALARYTDAVALYQAEGRRLQDSIAAIRAGALVGALLERNPNDGMAAFSGIARLPPGQQMPHAGHLAALVAGHQFQEQFKNLRDLQFLERNLQDWQQRLGVFDDMLSNRRLAYSQRLPAVLQRAGAAGLPALQQQRDGLAAALAQADAHADAHADARANAAANTAADPAAFADAAERALLARMQRVQAALAQAGNADDDALRERLRRVQGALTWQLAQAWPARAWDAKKALRATDQALAEAAARTAALARAQQDEPARFDAFGARIGALQARLQAMRPRLAALGGEQQAALQALAVAALQSQQQRLDVYAAQARLAIAQILDRAQVASSRTDDDDGKR